MFAFGRKKDVATIGGDRREYDGDSQARKGTPCVKRR